MLGPVFSTFVSFALQVSCLVHAVAVIDTRGELHIVNKNISPDKFRRPAVLAGTSERSASFPGPLIKAHKGAKLSINVINSLTDVTMNKSTSIHWHGIFQRHTAFADGPAFVTQCPISRKHSFKYEFSVPDQAGTFWYHSHLGVQYCDGLRGPLVIYDPKDPNKKYYDIDDESTIITLADWYHKKGPEVVAIGPPHIEDATLINGKGRWPGDPTAELAVFTVKRGKRYRFRLISMACDPSFEFSIDGHNMTIIEADGENTEPFTVNSIPIFAAQRYSFVLNANQPVGNYWIRAKPSVALSTSFDKGLNSAILRYEGAREVEPKTKNQTSVRTLDETDLHPLENPRAPGKPYPGGADVVLPLNLSINAAGNRFLVNGTTFRPPTVPVLLQILSGNRPAQELLPKGSVFPLPRNKVIEVVLMGNNAPGGPHPFHLHGHSFSVVQSAGGEFNFEDPVRRDVTPVVAGKNTVIRFETDNPGPWMLHCHIDFHLEAGLAVVLAEDVPDIRQANSPIPADWNKLCPIYDSLPPSEQ